jgi:hypothetical protein
VHLLTPHDPVPAKEEPPVITDKDPADKDPSSDGDHANELKASYSSSIDDSSYPRIVDLATVDSPHKDLKRVDTMSWIDGDREDDAFLSDNKDLAELPHRGRGKTPTDSLASEIVSI